MGAPLAGPGCSIASARSRRFPSSVSRSPWPGSLLFALLPLELAGTSTRRRAGGLRDVGLLGAPLRYIALQALAPEPPRRRGRLADAVASACGQLVGAAVIGGVVGVPRRSDALQAIGTALLAVAGSLRRWHWC